MHGREREWRTILDLLKSAEAGRSGTLLVDGEPGMGKSRLLTQAAAAASALGFSLALGKADEFGRLTPLAPLLMALDEAPCQARSLTGLDGRMVLVERLRDRVEERLAAGPLLVTLDDLHWADLATVMALRTLHWQLSSYPVVWVLARSTAETTNGSPEVKRLFELLERQGAVRVELGPLPDDAVALVAGDLLGAEPKPDLLALVSGAGGNPFLVTELIAGLRDEGALTISGGRAGLVSAQLPTRIQTVVRHRLDRLSPQAHQLIETAAVLGQAFTPDDVAELLRVPPAGLLPAIEESLAAGVLLAAPDALVFRHELVRRAVIAGIPVPLRQALHRQIGGLLLDRGGSAVRAAGHLLQGTGHGDTRALGGLDLAVAETRASAPETAAHLAARALELTDVRDPNRFPRTMTAIETMIEAGRLDDADRLVREALDRPPSALAAARLRCALSDVLYTRGRADEALVHAEKALTEANLPRDLSDRAVLAHLHALTCLNDKRVAERAAAILKGADGHGDAVVVEARVALAVITWDSGRLAEALRLAREAVELAEAGSAAARRTHPRFTLAAMLADVNRLDEARAVLDTARDEAESPAHSAWAASHSVLRARVELARGRLDDAVAEAEVGLRLADSLGTHLFSPLAAYVLAMVALRRGDLRTAALQMEGEHAHGSHHAATYARTRATMVAAQVAEARDGPQSAMKLVESIYSGLGEHRWVLIGEPAAGAWLARLALDVGDRPLAERVVAVAEDLAGSNPGFPAVVAAAAHARGLLDGDPAKLGLAAAEGSDTWSRASAEEDFGVALRRTGDHEAGIAALDRALAGYERTGATRDAARVRRRLRRAGVRHRHWSYADRPATGWESLTETENTVSLLVAQGWTNQQVANQMFISVHTVAFHLRQIFRKLGIGSRVQLTRLTVEKGLHP